MYIQNEAVKVKLAVVHGEVQVHIGRVIGQFKTQEAQYWLVDFGEIVLSDYPFNAMAVEDRYVEKV